MDYIGYMKPKTEQVRTEIVRIMNEHALSAHEFALRCGISKSTMKAILDVSTDTTQLGVLRKIAQKMDYKLEIKDDAVVFIEPAPEPNTLIIPPQSVRPTERRITEEEERILHILRSAGIETGDDAERMLGLFRVAGEIDAALIQQIIFVIKQIRNNDNR